jgi:hypothetical protein
LILDKGNRISVPKFPSSQEGSPEAGKYIEVVILTREGVVLGWILDVGCWIPETDFINDCR